MTNRRKVPNLVVDRGALVRVSLPFILLTLLSVVTVFVLRAKIIFALQQTSLRGAENLEAMNTLLDLQRTVTNIGAFGLLLMALLCVFIWLRLSHRVFGPSVPMRRHVQKLSEGDYSSRIDLRRGDEFQALAEDLNHLAEILHNSKK